MNRAKDPCLAAKKLHGNLERLPDWARRIVVKYYKRMMSEIDISVISSHGSKADALARLAPKATAIAKEMCAELSNEAGKWGYTIAAAKMKELEKLAAMKALTKKGRAISN